jgi:uncharacterized protein (DUF1778 family)
MVKLSKNANNRIWLIPAIRGKMPVPKWHHMGMKHTIEKPRKPITARVSGSVRVTLEQAQKDVRMVLFLLDHPPKPNKRLKEAVKAFKGTVRAQG